MHCAVDGLAVLIQVVAVRRLETAGACGGGGGRAREACGRVWGGMREADGSRVSPADGSSGLLSNQTLPCEGVVYNMLVHVGCPRVCAVRG